MLYLKQLGNEHPELHKQLTTDQLTITQGEEENRKQFTISWNTEWTNKANAETFFKLATELSSIPEYQPHVTISENQVIIKFIDIHNS